MAKIMLCRTTHLVEINGDHTDINDDFIWKIENLIGRDFCFEDILFKWISSNPEVLDTLSDNIGKCSNCGGWTTDSESIYPVGDVSNGAYVNGQLFCDECLPDGHHLKF